MHQIDETGRMQEALQQALHKWQDEALSKHRSSAHGYSPAYSSRFNSEEHGTNWMHSSMDKEIDNRRDRRLLQIFLNTWQEVAERNTNNFARCLWIFSCWCREVNRVCQYRRKLLKGIVMSKAFNFMHSYFQEWNKSINARSIRLR